MPSSTRKEMNQCLPSRETVVDFTTPPNGRDIRNFTHPNFGRNTRAHLRLIRSTGVCFAVGNRNDGFHLVRDFQRTFHVPCRRHAWSRSFSVCWMTWAGASPSQSQYGSFFASASCAHCSS